ncbi:hypothetical protein BK120_00360 [Paenibacillus sp. FSL A5-0031]|uniref:hypothetical protein n=1 Tax=Paenibacillus sp. FSL A5-0031 TaxID=1920420 RepID=UPI00096D58F7|nr:hypothetical protein [Paenibacillus sp. FSL A5-0031]OME87821.1 hypothetical protein BK120_00360 [Paenibacillus sp. FSL A5-0031]
MSNTKTTKDKAQQFPMKKLSPVSIVRELPPVRGNLRTSSSVDDFFNSVQWREVFANWAAEVRGNYLLRTEPLFNNQH